ncbi:hypothetical protein CTA21_16280 [Salmonella enterica]|nr:hypothetical protein [Salmonella enterica]EDZ0839909.1 hypothetical protein [Salmonella enterica subsp. enterica serovar Saintpaul]EEC1302907.1 hypothetical protein [Salmonella enterica]
MKKWVRVIETKGYQVCVETGVESGMPAIIFRLQKDGGLIRSKMCLEPCDKSRTAFDAALEQRNFIFESLDISTINAAVDSMLELEPELMDGSVHGFVMEPGRG